MEYGKLVRYIICDALININLLSRQALTISIILSDLRIAKLICGCRETKDRPGCKRKLLMSTASRLRLSMIDVVM